MLQKDDHTQQMVYYQVCIRINESDDVSLILNEKKAGIGTYTVPQIATPFWSKVSQSVDMAIAWNMHAHVMGELSPEPLSYRR